jgi:4-diphosphocytidyl-2-C-methyl-D-erythritol kinase
MQPLPTAPVFRALESGLLPDDFAETEPPHLASLDEILGYAAAHSNDLERPACGILPVIDDVLAVLNNLPGALLGRLSGSGPTCYALFREMKEAESAAADLTRERPGWWVQAVRLS